MRLLRGSGIAGLAAMARQSRARRRACWRGRCCDVPKSRLVATLNKAKIAFADDPTNRDAAFTRPRLRALMPALAEEGGDAEPGAAGVAAGAGQCRAGSAGRWRRALSGAEGPRRRLALRSSTPRPLPGWPRKSGSGCCSARSIASAMRGRPNSARWRLCWRRWTGPLRRRPGRRLKQTLAGAVISLAGGRIHVDPAPPRRGKTRVTDEPRSWHMHPDGPDNLNHPRKTLANNAII